MDRPAPDLVKRLERLERRCRWLGLTLLSVTVLLLGVAATPSADVMTVRGLRLVDEEGRLRAELAMREDSPGLFLLDAAGVERLLLVDQAEQTALFIKDAAGVTRLGAAQFAHGGGGFALHGSDSKGAAVLYLKGEGSLGFYDENGDATLRLGAGD